MQLRIRLLVLVFLQVFLLSQAVVAEKASLSADPEVKPSFSLGRWFSELFGSKSTEDISVPKQNTLDEQNVLPGGARAVSDLTLPGDDFKEAVAQECETAESVAQRCGVLDKIRTYEIASCSRQKEALRQEAGITCDEDYFNGHESGFLAGTEDVIDRAASATRRPFIQVDCQTSCSMNVDNGQHMECLYGITPEGESFSCLDDVEEHGIEHRPCVCIPVRE